MSDTPLDAPDPVDRFFSSGGEDVPADLVDAPEAVPAEPVLAPAPAAEPAPAPAGTLRDEAGRFTAPQTPVEGQPAPAAPAEPAAPQAPVAPAAGPPQVPLAALLEERRKYEARLADLEARVPRQEAPKGPTMEEDPVAFFKTQIDEVRRVQAETMEQAQARQRFEQLANACNSAEASFAATNKDYYQASQHLRSALTGFFEAQGRTPEQAMQDTENAAVTFAANALNAGKNPAVETYALAKRYGYQPAAALPPAPNPQPKPEDRIAAVARGQAAAKSLGAANGAAPEGDPLAALLTAADDPASPEFDRRWEQVFGRSKDRALFR